MARITFSIDDTLEPLIEERAAEENPSVSSYISGLVKFDLERAGKLPGTAAAQVISEAKAVLDFGVEPNEVFAALRELRVKASRTKRKSKEDSK